MKNEEITCPNCHTKLILKASKELRYCPCCAKELFREEKSVSNSFELNETETPLTADGREPVAVYSPKQYRKSSQTRQNAHISPNKRRNVKKPSLSEQIRDALFMVFIGCSVLFCLFSLVYIEKNRFWLYVVGFVLLCFGIEKLVQWWTKIIVSHHDKSIDKQSSTDRKKTTNPRQ